MKLTCPRCLDGHHRRCLQGRDCACLFCGESDRKAKPQSKQRQPPTPSIPPHEHERRPSGGGARVGAGRKRGSTLPSMAQAEVLAALDEGLTMSACARRCAVSIDQVRVIRRDRWEGTQAPIKSKLSAADVRVAEIMRSNGATLREIADRLDVTVNAIHKRLNFRAVDSAQSVS